jgi:hypothetical protein
MEQRTYISCPYLHGPFCHHIKNKGMLVNRQNGGVTTVSLGACSEENCPFETLIVSDDGSMKFEAEKFTEKTEEKKDEIA